MANMSINMLGIVQRAEGEPLDQMERGRPVFERGGVVKNPASKPAPIFKPPKDDDINKAHKSKNSGIFVKRPKEESKVPSKLPTIGNKKAWLERIKNPDRDRLPIQPRGQNIQTIGASNNAALDVKSKPVSVFVPPHKLDPVVLPPPVKVPDTKPSNASKVLDLANQAAELLKRAKDSGIIKPNERGGRPNERGAAADNTNQPNNEGNGNPPANGGKKDNTIWYVAVGTALAVGTAYALSLSPKKGRAMSGTGGSKKKPTTHKQRLYL